MVEQGCPAKRIRIKAIYPLLCARTGLGQTALSGIAWAHRFLGAGLGRGRQSLPATVECSMGRSEHGVSPRIH
jgi:hypothetical protein